MWRQIADGIAGDIRGGRLAAGQKLPTEAELAERWSVNRHTVRRALAALAADGLVRTAHGSGSFVEGRPLSYPISLRTNFSDIVRRAGHTPGGEMLASAIVGADPGIATMLGIAPDAPVTEVALRRFVDGVPVSHGRTWLPLPRFDGFAAAFAAQLSVTAALRACGVADYRRASTRVSARPAGAQDAERLDIAPGRIVLAVRSLNLDEAGVPVQAAEVAFAADRVELVLEPETAGDAG